MWNDNENNVKIPTYLLNGRRYFEKVLTGFVVLLLIITASNMILKKGSNKTASVNTEAIESTLVKSMEETKVEKRN